ncbi:hypothetical protein GCM10011521_23910 [Arenimonas soli]|uniref:DUF6249 domain-containing protein n=1 Tax=Arenimonas soli TaxID=2269504 RepID=A0ABQ1HQZ5_9GAMM|nr:DUF6249 domain-containing protein [Arenimonas soli]GGA84710.1 hypothetical protein GCM10011521_23910 [Arenimonas soli]
MELLPILIIPAAIMLPPVLITALVLRYRRARAEMRYRFLLQLAESGVALPNTLPGEAPPQDCDRRRALVLLAGGLGLGITLLALPLDFPRGHPVAELWGLGILPVALGLGYLGNWYLSRRGGGHG